MSRTRLALAGLATVALVGTGAAVLTTGAAATPDTVRVETVAAPVDGSSPQPPDAAPAAPADAISAERAREIALAAVGGGCVDDVERESRGAVWEVEIDRDGREFEVGVDAATGAVVRTEERADDDDDCGGRTVADRGDDRDDDDDDDRGND